MAVDVDHVTPDEEVEITNEEVEITSEDLNSISQATNKFLTVSVKTLYLTKRIIKYTTGQPGTWPYT